MRLELKADARQRCRARSTRPIPFMARLLGVPLEPDEASAALREPQPREPSRRATFAAVARRLRALADEKPMCLVDRRPALGRQRDARAARGAAGADRGDAARRRPAVPRRPRRRAPGGSASGPASSTRTATASSSCARSTPTTQPRARRRTLAEAELPESRRRAPRGARRRQPVLPRGGAAGPDRARRAAARDGGAWTLDVERRRLASSRRSCRARCRHASTGSSPQTREVVWVASAIGRGFGLPLLERLLPREQVVPALSELMRLDLIVEVRRRPAPEYRFRHGLVQEVAYASLLEPARRKLHRSVGEALEDALRRVARRGLRAARAPLRRGRRAGAGGRLPAAAGDAARAVYADREAVEYYQRARRVPAPRSATSDAPRDTLFKIALAHHLAFDFERAEEAYDEAFGCRVEELAADDADGAARDDARPARRLRPGRRPTRRSGVQSSSSCSAAC